MGKNTHFNLTYFIKIAILILLFAFLIKTFILEIYLISSYSMLPALLPDDYVFVSRYSYNIKTPENIPFTNINIPGLSFPGIKSVQRNDIVVFKKPSFPLNKNIAENEILVKRCIGIPGDTIKLSDLYLDLSKLGYSDSSEEISMIRDYYKNLLLVVPKKNDTIQLSIYMIPIMRNLILGEGNTFEIYNDTIYVNGKQKSEYVVGKNYYFMIGDNYLYSLDSRRFGFVPEDLLIGQVLFIALSFENDSPNWYNKIRWNRIGKTP